MNNEVLNPVFFEKMYFFLLGGQQFQVNIIREKNHARMRIKSKQYAFTVFFCGNLVEALDYSLVTCVDTVKCAGGYNCICCACKLINMVVNFQMPCFNSVRNYCLLSFIGFFQLNYYAICISMKKHKP